MKTVKIHRNHMSKVSIFNILASNRTTLSLLVLLTLSILVFYQQPGADRYWLVLLPTFMLLINFIMAVIIRRVLIDNIPLMLFHFSLIVLLVLIYMGNMTYLKATLELASMEEFSGKLENVNAGPWHEYMLDDTRFMNLGFIINYHKGVKRNNTINKISVLNNDGSQKVLEIGDHVPLVFGHYRFYTTHNKGYAPIFKWTDISSKKTVTGNVHLPAYPINEYKQALEWKIPGTQQSIWSMLQIDENVLPEDENFQFKIPEQHQMIIRYKNDRYQLEPGDKLSLEKGELQYIGLSTWMGYKVDYDWTRPWLLATVLIAIFNLFLHFIFKFRSESHY